MNIMIDRRTGAEVSVIRAINSFFVVDHDRYYRPICTSSVFACRFDPAKFERMTTEPYTHEVFVCTGFDDVISWVAQNTTGKWAFDGSWVSHWVVRFESFADAMKMRFLFPCVVDHPDPSRLVSVVGSQWDPVECLWREYA